MRRFRNCWRTRAAGILFAAALVGVFSAGCRDESPVRVERVNVVRGAESCALPGEMFPGPLVIELQGPQERGLLGGSGSGRPDSVMLASTRSPMAIWAVFSASTFSRCSSARLTVYT